MIGIGVPQYRCRLNVQSRNRYVTVAFARPSSASQSTIAAHPIRRGHAAEPAGVDEPLVGRVGDVRVVERRVVGRPGRGDHPSDRQPESLREREVTLVVGRHGHDGPRPVARQDVVRDPDRDALAVDRVDRVGAQVDAGLLALGREPLDLGGRLRPGDVGVDLRPAIGRAELRNECVLGSEHHERRPEQRVGPGREDAQLVAAGLVIVGRGREDDLAALAPSDPVRLLEPDRLRPVDGGEVEELVGVLRRPQVPLVEIALLDRRATSPAVAVGALDLLAGQRPVVGAPVDRRLPAVGEAGLEESQEHPLVPAVELGVARDDLVAPVEHRAHRPELLPFVLDVLHRPVARVDVVLDRGVLGRQAVRIEPDREEHVLAVHPVEAGQCVGRGHDVPVADVEVARRIGVHRQDVRLGPRLVVEVRLVQPGLVPPRLPAGLDRRGVVAFDPGAFGLGRHVRLVAPDERNPPPDRQGASRMIGVTGGELVELRGLEPLTF